MRTWMTLVLLVTITLAGCSDAPAKSDDGDEDTLDVETGKDTGAISGVVIDETITPIGNASVQIIDGEATTADHLGRFVFEDLAPGTYFLVAKADGYVEVQGQAIVEAGEVSRPKLQLPRDLSPEPYHDTFPFNGYMEVYGTPASFVLHVVLQEVGASICVCEWDIPLDSVPHNIIVEGYWEDSITDPRGPQQYYLEVFDWSIEDCLTGGYYGSGFNANITGCAWDQDRYRVALTGPQDWVALQQDYTLYVTPFYRAYSPEGWTFDPDA